jgi:UDP-N-acetylmuramoyl-tripeptide--D-alanyl-D-alanine ligase
MAVRIPLDRVLAATGGDLARAPDAALQHFSAAVIDGRAASPGALFFAVRGERFDGHDFVPQAVAQGAAGVVVQRGRGASVEARGAAVIEVDDTIKALGALGRAHRLAMRELKLAAVTGSNGKTTTKEMLAAILAAHAGAAAVLKTEGNLNNHLGVPLTLLRLDEAHRFAVVEMGMSALGEIAYLAELARPDVAVVVSIGPVHLEQLGGLANVARAKAEIFGGLGERGIAVYPASEALLAPYVEAIPRERRRSFAAGPSGASAGFDEVQAGPDGLRFALYLERLTSRSGVRVQLPLIGKHNASNAAAAAAAALALGVDEGAILDGLAKVQPAKHRLQLIPVGDRTVLDDCYNAAPGSMRAALDALAEITPAGRRRIAVLGDMLELGSESARLHSEVGAYAAARVDQLVTVGKEARAIYEAARVSLGERAQKVDDAQAAAARVRAVSGPGDVILVKASRGMRLEQVIEALGNGEG